MSKTLLVFVSAILATIIFTTLVTSYIITSEPSSTQDEPFFGEIVAPTDGVLKRPQGVAVNSTDHILVADTGNSIIQVFSSSGDFVGSFASADQSTTTGSLNRPFAIFTNSTNHEFVVDTFTGVIKVYENSTFATTFGSPGTGSGELYRPAGATSNTTHIFVADTFNNRINIYHMSNGTLMDTIP